MHACCCFTGAAIFAAKQQERRRGGGSRRLNNNRKKRTGDESKINIFAIFAVDERRVWSRRKIFSCLLPQYLENKKQG